MGPNCNKFFSRFKPLLKIFLVFGLLFLFLVAIQLFGASFKLLGKNVAEELIASTSNPFTSLFIGILATVLVQSSSVTTSAIVGLVSAGALTVPGAVPMIMGANIGTAVTNTLVSVAHIGHRKEFYRAFAGATMHDFFNLIAVAVMLPLELATGFLSKSAAMISHEIYGSGGLSFKSPIKVALEPIIATLKNFFLEVLDLSKTFTGIVLLMIAIILIAISLYSIMKLMRSMILRPLERMINVVFGSSITLTIFVGAIITIAVQSSSITTAILVPMVGTGILSLEAAFPLTLGANIGTTVTALLAALAADIAGLTIAFVHVLFNVIGVLVAAPFRRIRAIPMNLARRLAYLSARKKRFALFYVVGVYFVMPILFILLGRLL